MKLIAVAGLALAAAGVGGGCRAAPRKPVKPEPPTLDVVEPWLDPTAVLAQSVAAPAWRPTPDDRSAPTLAIRGATIWTATGTTIDDGTIVLANGAIKAVGATAAVTIPRDAKVIDGRGLIVTPGLIDSHSHLGVYPAPSANAHADGNESTAPVTAQAKARYGYWPQDPQIARAVAGGVTSALILPGSANLIGGEGFTVVMRPGRTTDEVAFPGAPRTIKMACGENPKRVYGDKGGPKTRMGAYAAFRAAFHEARAYLIKHATYLQAREVWLRKQARAAELDAKVAPGKPRVKVEAAPEPPAVDLKLETLAAVLKGEVLVQIHCYRSSDMSEMLAIADDLGFRIRSFHHALEAYKIRDRLVARGVAINTWADWWGFKLEAYDGIPENAAMFAAQGGRPTIHSDSAIGIQRLNQEAAKARAAGIAAGIPITENEALRWITANPAWVLGIEDVTGTLEVGKRADVAMWRGSPFSVYGRAELVIAGGHVSFDRSVGLTPSDFELGNSSLDPGEGAMMAVRPALLALLVVSTLGVMSEVAAAQTIAITDATVYQRPDRQLDRATVVIRDGKIVDVGVGIAVPANATRIDGTGKVVTAGLIEGATQLGLIEVDLEEAGNDGRFGTAPTEIHAAYRALDAFDRRSIAIPIARAGGVTSAVVGPRGGLIAGQAAWVTLADANVAPARGSAAMFAALGHGATGMASRGHAVERLRELLDDVATFRRNRAAFERNQARGFAAGRLDLEALIPVLDGRTVLVVRAEGEVDLRAALAVAAERKLRIAILGGTEAWRVAKELAAAKVPVILDPTANLPGSLVASDVRDDNATLLARAGVTVVVSTQDDASAVRTLRQLAGIAVANGLPWNQALAAVTTAPAQLYGVVDRGTLDRGKIADVVVWSGDPFELSTRAEVVVIGGVVQPTTSHQTRLRDRYRTLSR